jgi:hypothetical protein
VPVAIYLWYLWLAFEACISAIPSSSPNNRHVWCCVTVPRTASNPCRPFDFLLRHFSRSCTLCLFQAHWLKYVMRSANYWRRCAPELGPGIPIANSWWLSTPYRVALLHHRPPAIFSILLGKSKSYYTLQRRLHNLLHSLPRKYTPRQIQSYSWLITR